LAAEGGLLLPVSFDRARHGRTGRTGAMHRRRSSGNVRGAARTDFPGSPLQHPDAKSIGRWGLTVGSSRSKCPARDEAQRAEVRPANRAGDDDGVLGRAGGNTSSPCHPQRGAGTAQRERSATALARAGDPRRMPPEVRPRVAKDGTTANTLPRAKSSSHTRRRNGVVAAGIHRYAGLVERWASEQLEHGVSVLLCVESP